MEASIPDSLLIDLNQLQQKVLAKGLPVLVLFEGSSGRVIGKVNTELIRCLEPRGVVYTHFDPTEPDHPRSILDFFHRTPGKGQIGLFDRSWYSSIIEQYYNDDNEKELDDMLSVSNDLERYLTINGVLMIKIILLAEDSVLKKYDKQYGPRVPRKSFLSMDHIDQAKYGKEVFDRVYAKTNTEYAPWKVINAGSLKETVVETAQTIMGFIQKRLDSEPAAAAMPEIVRAFPNPRTAEQPDRMCPDYDCLINNLSEELEDLQMDLSLSRRSMVVCFEGWDASGKGSCIKHLCHALNPRGYDVVQTKAPGPEESTHTYMWRFNNFLPMTGHITVFDRTWYGRMMVEHIEGFCTEGEYRRSPQEINAFERMLVNNGVILLKFWLDVTPDEQLARFQKRTDDPLKQWKITDEDWRNRSKWEQYNEHVDVMIESTNTEYAPWTVVESNNKKYARVTVLQSVVDAMRKELKK